MSRTYKDMPYNVRVERALKGKNGFRKQTAHSYVNHAANNYEYIVSYLTMTLAYPGWDEVRMEEDKNLIRKMYEANENNNGHTVEFRHRVENAHEFFNSFTVVRSRFAMRKNVINNSMSKNIEELEGLDVDDVLHGCPFRPKAEFYFGGGSEEFSNELKNSKTILELEVRVPVVRRYSEDEVFKSYLSYANCHCSFCKYELPDRATRFDAHEWVNFFNSNNGSTNMGYEEELDHYYSTKDDRGAEYYFEMMALNSIDDDENYSAYVKKSVEDKNDNVVYVATFGS